MNLDELKFRLSKMRALRATHPESAVWVDGEILSLRQAIEDATYAHEQGFVGAIEWQCAGCIAVAVSAVLVAGMLYLAGVL